MGGKKYCRRRTQTTKPAPIKYGDCVENKDRNSTVSKPHLQISLQTRYASGSRESLRGTAPVGIPLWRQADGLDDPGFEL